MKLLNSLLVLICLIVILPSIAQAEKYECKYPSYSNINGNHKDDNFKLLFLIEENEEKAYIIGNLQKVEVLKIDRGMGISIIEITALGNIMTTVISKDMKSVHSRNTIGPMGNLIPSQYYGSCTKE